MANNDKKQAPEPEQEPSPPSRRGFASGYAVGLNLLSSVVVGVIFGLGLDGFFGTEPLFIILFLLLGMAAGFRGIWVYMQQLESHDKK